MCIPKQQEIEGITRANKSTVYFNKHFNVYSIADLNSILKIMSYIEIHVLSNFFSTQKENIRKNTGSKVYRLGGIIFSSLLDCALILKLIFMCLLFFAKMTRL
jgi:hypothetical protein